MLECKNFLHPWVQVTQEALQHSYREVQTLQKHRNTLQKQLGDIATKINSGMIPDPEDLELPDLQSAGSDFCDLVKQLTALKHKPRAFRCSTVFYSIWILLHIWD